MPFSVYDNKMIYYCESLKQPKLIWYWT